LAIYVIYKHFVRCKRPFWRRRFSLYYT